MIRSSSVRGLSLVSSLVPSFALLASLSLTPACDGGKDKDTKAGDKKETEEKAPVKERDPGTSIDSVNTDGPDISGPVPPETSAVFFSVDGALIPLGCFDKDKGKLLGGKDCGKLVQKDGEVYLKDDDSTEIDTIGEPKNALCEPGEGKPTSFSTAKLDSGEAFSFGVYPKSAAQKFISVSREDTTAGSRTGSLDAAEKKAVEEAIVADSGKAAGEPVNIHQVASLDVDGDSQPDTFISANVINPKDTARYLFSGLFMRSSKSPDKLVLLDKTKTNLEIYTLLGAIDLNGDGTHELWVNAAFNEGGGDRVIEIAGGKVNPLAKYSCGL